jgi:hypothetical protein
MEQEPKILTTDEFRDFIKASLVSDGTENYEAFIGKVGDTTKAVVKEKSGANVDYISTDSSSIVHAYSKPWHNLEADDMLLAVNVINTSNNINLSPRGHQNNKVLEFKKDIDGGITFMAEVRVKKGKLMIFDCWRKKKVRQRPDAAP